MQKPANISRHALVKHPCAVAGCALEVGALFCQGPSGAKAGAWAAGPKSRALETNANRLNRGGLPNILASVRTISRRWNAATLGRRSCQDQSRVCQEYWMAADAGRL